MHHSCSDNSRGKRGKYSTELWACNLPTHSRTLCLSFSLSLSLSLRCACFVNCQQLCALCLLLQLLHPLSLLSLSLSTSSSTADCHFCITRCHFALHFPHAIELRQQSFLCFSSCCWHCRLFIYCSGTPLPHSLSFSISVFCCVCSVCAIECNKWHTRMQTHRHTHAWI